MMRKKLLSGFLALTMLAGIVVPQPYAVSAEETAEPKEVVLEKSTLGNPIAGFNENGEIEYAGDPNILVDGDTVYLYVGHDDTSSGGGYTMPNYFCYSTTDMINWEFEGNVMNMTEVSWADNVSAWAAQVVKVDDMYYMLFCAENKGSRGKEVGVAVSSTPTGPFVPEAEPLFNETLTNTHTCKVLDPETELETTANQLHADEESGYGNRSSFGWEDIDPTFWLDVDENGETHRYLMWGNTNVWMCELNEDMVSIKDQNGDGQITQGYDADIWFQNFNDLEMIDGVTFTEAPYLYRRQDENGNYYGDYYVFFATHWREEMGYATCSELGPNSVWTYGGGVKDHGELMDPTATSNTNHPAVFDFKGKTYFVYHNGSLPGGSGFRRVACVEELIINEDGTIDKFYETSTGISGKASLILDSSNTAIAHDVIDNSISDPDYEYNYPAVNVKISSDLSADTPDAAWEIEPGKADKTNPAYVTIEAFNKPGMYIRATEDGEAVLSRDHNNDAKSAADGTTIYTEEMTFHTVESYDGTGVAFESVAYPGMYLAIEQDTLTLTSNYKSSGAVFSVSDIPEAVSATAQKTVRTYEVGEELNAKDIRMKISYSDGTYKTLTKGFKSNAKKIDMTTAGTKEIVLTYTENGLNGVQELSTSIMINVCEKMVASDEPVNNSGDLVGTSDVMEDLPEVKSTHTVGALKYQVTKVDEYNTDGTNGTVTVTGTTKKKATSVVIPDEIEINGYSFAVTKIANKAFQNCKKLKKITIGDNVKSIGSNAFKGINKKAAFNVSTDRYDAVKKLLKKKVGFKKPMKIKEV
ncbi:MAG: family 43 glycosylhydrolase [Lachnospiraceae bacterium]|nr:family 43 glycosylhydrolase [Lachnospiraceae bacterium]